MSEWMLLVASAAMLTMCALGWWVMYRMGERESRRTEKFLATTQELLRAEKSHAYAMMDRVMRMQREGFVDMPEAEPAVVHEGEEQEGEWYVPEPINWRTPPPGSA